MKLVDEHSIHLYLALVRAYDYYITPLNCNVRCWKSLIDSNGMICEGWFLLGMSFDRPDFDANKPHEKWDIIYFIPLEYWNKINVIQFTQAPPYESSDRLERLLKL